MELRHLRYFVAVAEELHFRRAAERLHVSQPPLSQQIKALEDEVGVPLLTRTSRHVELTDAGRTFLELARRALAEADHATEAARRVAQGELGWLRLGFVDSAAYELLPQMLRTFHARYPDVRLDVRELPTEVQLDLIGSELDLGIVRDPRLEAGSPLTVTPLLREPLFAVVPETHRLAKRTRIDLSDLAGEPFVMVSRAGSPTVHDHIVVLCLRAGFSPRTVEEALQYPSILGLVAAAYGVAVIPACATLLHVAGVSHVPLDDPDAFSVLALVTSTADTRPTVSSFLRTMGELLGPDGHPRRRRG